MKKTVSVIIPLYNEQENVEEMVKGLLEVFPKLNYEFNITFIDDGSNDGTLESILEQVLLHKNIFFISLSRNFGHQNALKAAIDYSNSDCIITMDGDMQHPPELIPELIKKWEAGNDIVYTIRIDNSEQPILKRRTSNLFYNLINTLSGIELEAGTADFRLLDKKVVDILRTFQEEDIFWRGLIKWVGFKQVSVEYMPGLRKFGKSKYTYKKMLEFGLKGITSFSTKPLTVAIYVGFSCAFLSLFYIPYVLYSLFFGVAISGWASIIVTVAFLGGLQLMILGIIGLYLGKTFIQGKHRPNYIIKSTNL